MNWTALLGAGVAGLSLAVIIGEGNAARRMGQPLPEEEEDPGPSGGGGAGGGGAGAVGVAAGAPSGGPSGPAGGPGPVGVVGGAPGGGMPGGAVQGMPMPVSNPSPAGGFPGIFPTAGPSNSLFFGGGGGFGWWGWPYPYPVAQPPRQWDCRWESTPPKDDTPLICRQVRYPVAYGPPGWGLW